MIPLLCADCTVIALVAADGLLRWPAAAIPKIGTVKLSKTAYTYNGKVQRPGVVVKDRTGKALKGGVD